MMEYPKHRTITWVDEETSQIIGEADYTLHSEFEKLERRALPEEPAFGSFWIADVHGFVPYDAVGWAEGKWREEVGSRPLSNIHRRTLDDTWRQVIRHFGGNPDDLVGPSHDELLAAAKGQK